MKVKTKGTVLIILGILGAIFIAMFDTIMGKARNYIGPKSIIALIICTLLIIQGIISLLKKPKA
ncbi:MAG: hypothetical protein KKB22_00340 [Candidatus Omnitrophica bacterium]|nr:hypothetical protein [Candidatus Omnitrophota bacterium]